MDSPSASDSDSDYEYEYSTTETETFYITLDLTSHLPRNARKRKRDDTLTNINHPTPAPTSAPPAVSRESATRAQSEDGVPFATGNHSEHPVNRFQLLDLCTDNPLLSYNNKLFSCYWAAAIGTDMLFDAGKKFGSGDEDNDNVNDTTAAPPNPQTEPPKPLLTKPNYTLLALSTLHLVATPAKLIPRDEPLPISPLPLPTITPTTTTALSNSIPTAETPSFLTRLAALKALKNEHDTVPLHSSALNTNNLISFPIPTPSYTCRSISPATTAKPSTPAPIPSVLTPPTTPKTGPGSRGGKGSRGRSRRGGGPGSRGGPGSQGGRAGGGRGRGRGGRPSTSSRLGSEGEVEEQGVAGLSTATGTMMHWAVDPQLERLGGASGTTTDVAEGKSVGENAANDTGVEASTTITAAGDGLDANANANANDEMVNDTTMTWNDTNDKLDLNS